MHIHVTDEKIIEKQNKNLFLMIRTSFDIHMGPYDI